MLRGPACAIVFTRVERRVGIDKPVALAPLEEHRHQGQVVPQVQVRAGGWLRGGARCVYHPDGTVTTRATTWHRPYMVGWCDTWMGGERTGQPRGAAPTHAWVV